MVETTVIPLRACFFRILTKLSAFTLSSPEVGSSRISKDGSVTISTAIAVLFLSPPEMVFFMGAPMGVLAEPVNESSLINSSTLASYSSIGIFSFNLAAKVIASLGVKCL